MRIPRAIASAKRRFGILLGLCSLVFGVVAGAATPVSAASPIEVNYQNPVTALPPISRPSTPHCTVTAHTLTGRMAE